MLLNFIKAIMHQTRLLRVRGAASSLPLLSQQALPNRIGRKFNLNSFNCIPSPPKRLLSTTPQNEANSILTSPSKLSGRTCMITGGTSGIGFAIAERFLQEGAERVILVGRSYERLVDAASRLETQSASRSSDGVATQLSEEQGSQNPDTESTGPKPKGSLITSSDRLSLLVGDVSEAGEWVRDLEKAMKPVDILVNAAGISISSILPKSEPADISRILRTNLEGAMLTSRALVRAAIRSRVRGRADPGSSPALSKCIINVSSLLALKGGTGAVPYAASKAGVLGLTRSLTVEAAASLRDVVIRSNAIVPGYIETPMISDFTEGEASRLKESIPLRRFGRPAEVADAAVFLAHNEYANNCVLNLDGGLSAV